MLPITAKLNPFAKGMRLNWRNVGYLLEAAVLTRLAVAMTRIWQNAPSKFQNHDLTPNQKRKAFRERLFVEGLGTVSFVLLLHLGQDLTARLLEKFSAMPLLPKNAAGLKPEEIRIANEALRDTYGSDARQVLSRILHGDQVSIGGKSAFRRANWSTLREVLQGKLGETAGDALFSAVKKHVEPAIHTLNKNALLTLLGGITLTVLATGPIIQRVNDRIFSPWVSRRLAKRYGEDPKPRSLATVSNMTLPATSGLPLPEETAGTLDAVNTPFQSPPPLPQNTTAMDVTSTAQNLGFSAAPPVPQAAPTLDITSPTLPLRSFSGTTSAFNPPASSIPFLGNTSVIMPSAAPFTGLSPQTNGTMPL